MFSISPANSEEIKNWLYVSGNSQDISRTSLLGTNSSGFNQVKLGSIEIGTELNVKRYAVHILDSGGVVWGWGSDGREVGIGSESVVSSPVQLGIPEKVKQIAGGDNHTLALTSSGKIYAWGWNGHGQLGVGGTEDYASSWNYSRPTLISLPGGLKAKFIAAGGWQSFAVGEDNSIF
jgi:alpha-tubulin suppressor-like RCC1 family protein